MTSSLGLSAMFSSQTSPTNNKQSMPSAHLQSEATLHFSYSEESKRTRLARRQLGGLSHISKGYWDDELLSIQLVNPTAGLFGGDKLEIEIDLAEQSSVAITSPSATRFHTMADDAQAEVNQHITLAADSHLDYWPEMLIPQRGAHAVQRSSIHLSPSSSLLFLDSLAPGRVAHGEINAYRTYQNHFDLFIDGELRVRERLNLTPENEVLPMSTPDWEACYMANLWCYDSKIEVSEKVLAQELKQELGPYAAVSDLGEGLYVFRLLAPKSVTFHKQIKTLRSILKNLGFCKNVDFRKL